MYELTNHERRWNPTVRCQGNRVTVHGATRHTSAALLLFNSDKLLQSAKPSQQVIMELQQRSDTRVFFKHYFHPHEEEIQKGLEYGAAPSPFKKKRSTTAEDAVVASVDSPGQGAITEEPEPTTRATGLWQPSVHSDVAF